MLETELVLRSAWGRVLSNLGLDDDDAVVLGGPMAEHFGSAIPFAVVDEVAGLVSLGRGPLLPDDATVVDSRLDASTLDAVILVDAWRSHDELARVIAEGRRILRAGGRLYLAELDGERLIQATPAMRASALFYGPFGDRSGVMGASGERFPATDLGLLRAGFVAIEQWPVEFPVAAFDDADGYVAAVTRGMWPGIDTLSQSEWSGLEPEVRSAVGGPGTPILEYQPWLVASGVRAGG